MLAACKPLILLDFHRSFNDTRTTKAQLNGRVALRVNDGISSRMIIGTPDAQYLQKHGDMIYSNSDTLERAQGYLIEIPELDEIVQRVKDQNK